MTRNLFVLLLGITLFVFATFCLASLPALANIPKPTFTPTPQPTVKPGIPKLIDQVFLGVPAGNGYQPSRLAVDSERHRVYSLNAGFEGEGNTISVLDTQAGEITALVRLNKYARYPQDLVLDPYRPRLYALWRGSADSEWQSGLTIIDTEALTVTQTITDVLGVAPAPDRLYLANNTRLWTVNPHTLTELASRDGGRNKLYGPLWFNPKTDRLYLRQAEPSSLEIVSADTLATIGRYTVDGTLNSVVIDPNSGNVIVLVDEHKQRTLRMLDADGHPSPISEVVLADSSSYEPKLILHEQTVYVTEQAKVYQLRAFMLPDLTPVKTLPLPPYPGDLVVDSATGHFYVTYTDYKQDMGHYILEIDPNTGMTKTVYTYLSIIDALIDQAADRLYVLNEQGTVRVLRLDDQAEMGRVETGFQRAGGCYVGYGHLSLDPGRNRLYVDGPQLRVVDTRLLTVTRRLDEFVGQVTPDPKSDRLYFTGWSCGTLILNADTFTGTALIYPSGMTQQPPPMSQCLNYTRLDAENRILYGQSGTCFGGSSCGGNGFMSAFDVSGSPRYLGGTAVIMAFDPGGRRAFGCTRWPYNEIFINRFEVRGEVITKTKSIFGAELSDPSFYDPINDRLYSNSAVFDGDLAILASFNPPGDLLAFDQKRQRLYFSYRGNLLIAATGGGQLELPSPVGSQDKPNLITETITASDGTQFRLETFGSGPPDASRVYRSTDAGQTWSMIGRGLPGSPPINVLAVSPDFEQTQTLLAGFAEYYSGGGGKSAGGLYRSTDGGETWWPATRGLTSLRIKKITFSPDFAKDQTISLTATDASNEQGFRSMDHEEDFHSIDGGQSWSGVKPN